MSDTDPEDLPDEIDLERVPQMVAGRDQEQRAERVEYTRASVVRAVAVVVGVLLAAAVVVAVSTVVWWVVIAAVIGAVLRPASRLLTRRLPTGVALALLVVVVLGSAGWLGFHGLSELKSQSDAVRSSAQATAQQAEQSEQYGATARTIAMPEKVDQAFDGIPGSSSSTSAPLAFVGSSGGALFSIAMLSLLFVIFWPTLFTSALDQVARSSVRHDLLRVHLLRTYRSCTRYAWLMAARAAVVGVVTGLVAELLGVGAPTLVGMWFAICSIVPALGLVVAILPLALLEVVHDPARAAVLLVVAVVAQALDARFVQRRIDAASVRVGPTLSLVAILLGFELYGVGGVVVALAVCVFALAFVRSLTAYRGDLTDAVKDLTDHDEDAATARQTTAKVTAPDGAVTWWYELGWRAPLAGAATLVAIVALVGITLAGPIVALVATAILLSFGFDPLITRFQGWSRLSRGLTVGLVFCVLSAVAIGGIVAFLPSTVDQVGTVQQDLPRAVDDLTTLPVIGPVLADNHAPDRIREWAAGLPAQLSTDTSGITAAASTIGSAVLGVALIAFLLMAVLIDGPYLVGVLEVAVPERRAAMLGRAGTIAAKTAGRYFSGSLLLAGLQAVQVLVTGLALGVPLTPVLAVWAGIWTLVPQIGGAIGGLPFILLAFSHSATSGVIAAVAFGLYLVIANNVLHPVIIGKAVDASPLATMALTIAGFTLLGVIGAVLAVPLFGAGKSIYKQLHSSDGTPSGRAAAHAPGRLRSGITSVRTRAEGPPPRAATPV
jgi:predicted PurR-regulated permease PerM